jgi:uncharacterized phiE125 gp8 family phage protein
MTRALIAPPSALPVTIDEIKAHLRIETADEDAWLLQTATAATAHVEARCGRQLMAQTWRVYLDQWPASGVVRLPVSPVLSVAEVRVFGMDGDESPLVASAWSLDRVSDPPRLAIREPLAPGQAMNGIEIDVVAGHGESGADVPDALRRAILVLCAHWHSVRGSAADAAALGLEPAGFGKLIAPFSKVRL